MSKKNESVKKEVKPQEDEKGKSTPEPKKPQKRKEIKEGIEVKDDGVYFDVLFSSNLFY